MSIALERFCCILQFNMPFQVEFFTCICLTSCGCNISSNVVLNTMESLALIKRDANCSSEAYAITF